VCNALLEIRAFQAFPHFLIGVLHRRREIDEQGVPQLALHDAGRAGRDIGGQVFGIFAGLVQQPFGGAEPKLNVSQKPACLFSTEPYAKRYGQKLLILFMQLHFSGGRTVGDRLWVFKLSKTDGTASDYP
jgi:hypothetical protein